MTRVNMFIPLLSKSRCPAGSGSLTPSDREGLEGRRISVGRSLKY